MVNVSELHKRLSHLVNYSSQLIFVSGDSIADQQKTLSAFLSSQQENTEISFFAGSKDKQASDYRSAICRQLGGHQVGSFVRPLQQLLGDSIGGLSSDSRSYLVCITQAESLASSFLQELWDWVMHAQQTSPGIHLNIILFGESLWAKKSQEWLPMQNSHRPVLLSSELVNPVGFDVNALEALMADKSSWFSTSNQPLVSNKWFISSVLSMFLVIFVGLMAWQYPAHIATFITGDIEIESTFIAPTEQAQNQIEYAVPYVEEDGREIILNAPMSIARQPREINELRLEVIDLASTQDAKSITTVESMSITDTLLVANWSDSVAASTQQKDNEPTIDKPEEVLARETSFAETQLDTASNADGDFQVPDIISVEQLDAQFNNEQGVRLALASNASNTVAPQTKIQKPLPQTQESSFVSKSSLDYQFDETTLLSMPTNSVVLQLSGIQNPVVLENYLSDNNLKASTWVYETQRYGGPWYVVLYRQPFESIDAALSEVSSLPSYLKEAQPFAKSINQIQQEINQQVPL
jgi:DamX protein